MDENGIIEEAMSSESRRVRLLLEGILEPGQRRALVRGLTPPDTYARGVLHAFRAQVQHLGLRNEAELLSAVDAAIAPENKD